jgi:DNA mismatch endonuclease (patch repair protein)
MQAVKGKDTSLERLLDEAFRKMGWDYDRNAKDVLGNPDFVFRGARLLVFAHGDFWHGWRFPVWSRKLSRYWKEKIERNRRRDRLFRRRLRRHGWRVLCFWGHQIERDLAGVVAEVAATLKGRGLGDGSRAPGSRRPH